jgi:hypothetical protein
MDRSGLKVHWDLLRRIPMNLIKTLSRNNGKIFNGDFEQNRGDEV